MDKGTLEKLFEEKIEKYSQTFDDVFPALQLNGMTMEEMIAIIDKCIASGKPIDSSIVPGFDDPNIIG